MGKYEASDIKSKTRSSHRWRWPLCTLLGVIALGAVAGESYDNRSLPQFSIGNSTGVRPFFRIASRAYAGDKPSYSTTEWGTRIFRQRKCQGADDCTQANIEAEQTETSRMVNRLSRTSTVQAVQLLGAPDFVLRAKDKVPVFYYKKNPTELGAAHAIIMWRNGPCVANEVHVVSFGGQVSSTVMTGGNECTSDGSPFPMPTDTFGCKKGRKSDPLCKLKNVLALPGMH